MALTLEDQSEIFRVLSLYGHLIDERELDRLGEVYIEGGEYDASSYGLISVPEGLARMVLQLGDNQPIAHLMGIAPVIVESGTDTALVHSKGLGLRADGTVTALTFHDRFDRTALGWRIRHRAAYPRKVAITPSQDQ
ncbi:nuclear transport factor 2 family protein [Nocardia yunnanensis]|uniref:Nuclear transport factor 2 family protein n=1 Tax=Nocardia yunnanensis TaxID=2382165 RepID=A0A386ZJA3_9NOCA|nr:nuclear transport factor 2 family protein [Nocardia yunnanensis]AYF77942.1 nuclear transport factor 2 family protein [Nocardia yunnanensis]